MTPTDRGLLVAARRERTVAHVAIRFRISPSRISKIQQAIEGSSLTPEQVQAFMSASEEPGGYAQA